MAGETIRVHRGAIRQAFTEGAFPCARLSMVPTQDAVYLDVVTGRCDAAAQGVIAAQDLFLGAPEGQGFKFFGRSDDVPKHQGGGAGVGVRKTDAELRDRLSAAIAAIRANGVHQEISGRSIDVDIYGW